MNPVLRVRSYTRTINRVCSYTRPVDKPWRLCAPQRQLTLPAGSDFVVARCAVIRRGQAARCYFFTWLKYALTELAWPMCKVDVIHV